MEVDKDIQKLDANNTSKAFDMWSFSVHDIAVQITLIEFNFYKVLTRIICLLALANEEYSQYSSTNFSN
jgi:hypothetical protein